MRAILSNAENLKTISAEAARLMAVSKEKVWFGGGPKFEAAMAFLAEDLGNGEFETVSTEPVQVLGWAEAPTVAFNSMAELNAYRIGDHVWCAATVRWVLSGPAVLDNTHRVEAVGCAWETRVLVSTTNTESRLTVLRSQATRALSTSDFVAFAPSASSLAKRRGRQAGASHGEAHEPARLGSRALGSHKAGANPARRRLQPLVRNRARRGHRRPFSTLAGRPG